MKILQIQNNNFNYNVPALKKQQNKTKFSQSEDTCSFNSNRSKLIKLKHIDEYIANILEIGKIKKEFTSKATKIESFTENQDMYQQILTYTTKNSNLTPLIVDITHPNRVNKFNKLVSTRAQELNPELQKVHQDLSNSYLKQFVNNNLIDKNKLEKDAHNYANQKLINYMSGSFDIE